MEKDKKDIVKKGLPIPPEKIVAYCKRENAFQLRVYAKKIRAKDMTRIEANTNYAIISIFGRLAEAMIERELTLDDVFELVKSQPQKKGQIGLDLKTDQ